MSAAEQGRPVPIREYAPGTPLVIVSASAWEDAQQAECAVPELEDALANCNAYAVKVWDLIADFLLSYSGDGDTSDPQSWQAGHNYAMREAARMVRERWPETVERKALLVDPDALYCSMNGHNPTDGDSRYCARCGADLK